MLLLPIMHRRLSLIADLIRRLLKQQFRLLLLLDDAAASAAAGQQQVHEAVALQVVLAADVRSLHPRWDP